MKLLNWSTFELQLNVLFMHVLCIMLEVSDFE